MSINICKSIAQIEISNQNTKKPRSDKFLKSVSTILNLRKRIKNILSVYAICYLNL